MKIYWIKQKEAKHYYLCHQFEGFSDFWVDFINTYSGVMSECDASETSLQTFLDLSTEKVVDAEVLREIIRKENPIGWETAINLEGFKKMVESIYNIKLEKR